MKARIQCVLCLKAKLPSELKQAVAGTYRIFEFGGLVPYELAEGQMICGHHHVIQDSQEDEFFTAEAQRRREEGERRRNAHA